MPTDEPELPNVCHSENTPPRQRERLSRSPHPYHRQRSAIVQHDGNLNLQLPDALLTPGATAQRLNIEPGFTYFDADHRKRRKRSSSPSDSGTEADDERGSSLLGLPAPPNRLRKGLKGTNDSGTASPLLTPSYLDEEPRRSGLKAQIGRRGSLQSQTCTVDETAELREKFTRRRRAELIRRASETILIGVVGLIACRRHNNWPTHSSLLGIPEYFNTQEVGLSHASLVLSSHAILITSLYVLYPLRIIYQNHALGVSRNRSWFYVHIPAAFDPATLLYPILVPVFAAMSLLNMDVTVLLTNLVLSIASIPSKIVPFNTDIPWYYSMQWLLSIVPVLASRWQHTRTVTGHLREEVGKTNVCNDEVLLLLYPLHQSLLSVLGYLTTTSLLPAEIQLLSIGMINLLLHVDSPQTVILKSLLWIGGLAIFIFGGKVLTWGVALARIPNWRFRRPYARTNESNLLLSALDDSFYGRLSKLGLMSTHRSDSESSESGGSKEFERSKTSARKKHRKIVSIDYRRMGLIGSGALVQLQSNVSATGKEEIEHVGFLGSNGKIDASESDLDNKRRRRYTLPAHVRSPPISPSTEKLKRSRTTQSHTPKSWSLRSFTKAQAIVVKWIFALYVYTVTLATIAFGIRIYVARYALHGQEPVGWALAYLLGDIRAFRQFTISGGLDEWIYLPKQVPSYSIAMTSDLSGLHVYLGAATTRLLICAYCLIIIVAGLGVVFRLSAVAEVDTRRKVFHGMMVAMFLPTIFIDPTFVSLAFVLILAIFLLLDLFRASQLPPLSKALTYFLAPYVDGRDHRGPVIVSHIFLLIGCAIPLWLSLAAINRTGEGPWEGWDVQRREVSMISGIVCVGMGDAAASLIGRRYGRHRWCWSGGKSLEGSLAFAVAVILGLGFARLWLQIGGWQGVGGDPWTTTVGKASIAACGASLTEAVLTGGNDNIIVPVILWLLVRGLRI